MRTRRLLGLGLQILGLLTLAGALLAAAALLTAGLWLRVEDPLRPAEAIVVLAGDARRPLYAADLYHQGLAGVIYLSNSRHQTDPVLDPIMKKLGYPDLSPAELYTEILKLRGVPATALRRFGGGHISTLEEAEALRTALPEKNATLIVVTSPFHCRRAKRILESVLPEATVIMRPMPYESFKGRWWTDRDSAIKVLVEAAKTVFYHLGLAFRSTDNEAERGGNAASGPVRLKGLEVQ
ncbi:MAG: YdcF family protein [Desulfovibrionaceae bacterium]|nr:YdcF family protein [Desulfovibrionaceae bacterium]